MANKSFCIAFALGLQRIKYHGMRKEDEEEKTPCGGDIRSGRKAECIVESSNILDDVQHESKNARSRMDPEGDLTRQVKECGIIDS